MCFTRSSGAKLAGLRTTSVLQMRTMWQNTHKANMKVAALLCFGILRTESEMVQLSTYTEKLYSKAVTLFLLDVNNHGGITLRASCTSSFTPVFSNDLRLEAFSSTSPSWEKRGHLTEEDANFPRTTWMIMKWPLLSRGGGIEYSDSRSYLSQMWLSLVSELLDKFSLH